VDPTLLEEFVLEAEASLNKAEKDLLALEKSADPLIVGRIFRALHSIKSASAFLALTNIEKIGHQMETLLHLIRARERTLSSAMIDAMLQAVDQLYQMITSDDLGKESDVNGVIEQLEVFIRSPINPPSDFINTIAEPEQSPITGSSVTPSSPSPPPPSKEAALSTSVPIERATTGLERSGEGSLPSRVTPAQAITPYNPDDHHSTRSNSTSMISYPPGKPTLEVEPVRDDVYMRVRVKLLDDLLELTGNMVMARNQLVSNYHNTDDAAFLSLSQCVTEVHQTIVQTRMQSIGTLFDRCERMVRDLARQLGKEVRLEVTGSEVELDRSVIEAFSDPLSHLIRNALDHGLESPTHRISQGKPRVGTLRLSVHQQADEIILSLEDDGQGIDPEQIRTAAQAGGIISESVAKQLSPQQVIDLIFHPGFSTSQQVTQLSGRGVGLDVVRTNLEILGGIVEVQSTRGKGTIFLARLPLTQALVTSSLIPSIVVNCETEQYLIPQSSVAEIIPILAQDIKGSLHPINNRILYQLRDLVLPVVELRELFHPAGKTTSPIKFSDQVLIVMHFREKLFGVLVDAVIGYEEVVVRPLPGLVRNCKIFGGLTVMGNGRVCLILDAAGIVATGEFNFTRESMIHDPNHFVSQDSETSQRYIVFNFAENEYFAIPLEMVSYIEKISLSSIRPVGTNEYIQVAQRTLPLLRLDRVLSVGPLQPLTTGHMLIPSRVNYPIAVLTGKSIQMVDVVHQYESRLSDAQGILGTFIHEDKLVMMLDLYRLFEQHSPDRYTRVAVNQRPAHILVAEDSPFFQNLLRSYLEQPQRHITMVEDGEEALEVLRQRPNQFNLIVSDIEMPNLDGFGLIQAIRADTKFREIPVIALTSLSSPTHVERGMQAGFDSYLIKIDKEQLLSTIEQYLIHGRSLPIGSQLTTRGG